MADFFDPDDYQPSTPAAPAVATPAASPVAAPVDLQPVTSEKPKFFELKPVGAAIPAPVVVAAVVEVEEVAVEESAIETPVAVETVRVPTGIKMPEPVELPSEFPSFQAPEGYHVDLSDLPIESTEPMTRRQMREMEKLTGSDFSLDAEPEYEIELPFTSDLAEQVPDPEDVVVPDLVEPIVYSNDNLFNVSPGLLVEPTTNSIVIDQVQDLTNYTATISETGEILTTGAIQLPILSNIDTETGEIAVIEEAQALDEAIAIDNATGFINTIAPMRVTGIVNAAKKFHVIPTNLKRGKNHPYLVLTAAIVMVAIGGLTVAAIMLKII